MRSFTDNQGRVWQVRLSFGDIERVTAMTGVNLGAPLDGSPSAVDALRSDVVRLVAVLYAACKPQVDAGGLVRDQFAEALCGVLPAASEALWSEWMDFFRRYRPEAAGAMEMIRTADLQRIEAMAAMIARQSASRNVSTSSPPSPASIPDSTPGGN